MQISIPTLQEAFKVLLPIAYEWTNIGIILGIPHGQVEVIQQENRRVNDCLRKMLNKWLSQTSPQPSWKDLAEAVELLGDHIKAKEIKDTYLFQVQNILFQ